MILLSSLFLFYQMIKDHHLNQYSLDNIYYYLLDINLLVIYITVCFFLVIFNTILILLFDHILLCASLSNIQLSLNHFYYHLVLSVIFSCLFDNFYYCLFRSVIYTCHLGHFCNCLFRSVVSIRSLLLSSLLHLVIVSCLFDNFYYSLFISVIFTKSLLLLCVSII